MKRALTPSRHACYVVAEINVGGVTTQRVWPTMDIMKTSTSRGWTTRKFNERMKIAARDEIVTATWVASYGPPSYTRVSGRLVGVNGRVHRHGVFD